MSFISPCMLPLLPVYISYFAGGAEQKRKTLFNALCFVGGFTVVFCALGVFAGTVGALLSQYRRAVGIVCGVIVVLFGLSYLEVFRLPVFQGGGQMGKRRGALSSFLFGIVYSVSLTPCVGAFLGSALMLASTRATAAQGALLLLLYSLGLGLPFLVSAVLIDKLEGAFRFIKAHYRVVNAVCGGFLLLVGAAMIFGWMDALLAAFS